MKESKWRSIHKLYKPLEPGRSIHCNWISTSPFQHIYHTANPQKLPNLSIKDPIGLNQRGPNPFNRNQRGREWMIFNTKLKGKKNQPLNRRERRQRERAPAEGERRRRERGPEKGERPGGRGCERLWEGEMEREGRMNLNFSWRRT